MATSNILDVNKIPTKIIEIIQNSNEYCFLVTAYFQTWDILDRELEKAAKQNKKIIFMLRDNEKNHEYEYLNDYGFDIVFVENLHTKLYFNESESLISSMNLYKYSTENNYELGYYFSGRYQSKEFLEKVIKNDILLGNPYIIEGRYFSDSKQNNNKNMPYKQHRFERNEQKILSESGHCIRCNTEIPLNPDRPLCDDCFSSWVQWQNPDWKEYYCHICGNETLNSKGIYYLCYASPICSACKRKMNFKSQRDDFDDSPF